MAKLTLNETQLHRLNKATYRAELVTLEAREILADKQRIYEEIQKETNSTFQTWNAGTGETDFEIPEPEIIPPRKRAKNLTK
jgi:hypothetical protein